MVTPKEFAKRMNEILQGNEKGDSDKEVDHSDADLLLCEVLKEQGFEKGVKLFYSLNIWYA